jgi:hypothetical protein
MSEELTLLTEDRSQIVRGFIPGGMGFQAGLR